MKRHSSTTRRGLQFLIGVVVVLVAATLSAPPAVADRTHNPNPGSISPDTRPFGKSYGDWGAAWWKWAGAFPPDKNPITAGDGKWRFDQPEGPVWFLAGNFGGPVERRVTVPRGKALFLPLVNFTFWAPEDCVFLKLEKCRARDLTEKLREIQNQTEELVMSVDGVAYTGLDDYAALSRPFALRITKGDLFSSFGYSAGVRYPTVSGGHWMMLKPLSPGRHTLHWGGISKAPEFNTPTPAVAQDVTYYVTVR